MVHEMGDIVILAVWAVPHIYKVYLDPFEKILLDHWFQRGSRHLGGTELAGGTL